MLHTVFMFTEVSEWEVYRKRHFIWMLKITNYKLSAVLKYFYKANMQDLL